MFPAIEEFAGKPGLMDGPKGQHEEFTPGLEEAAEVCWGNEAGGV